MKKQTPVMNISPFGAGVLFGVALWLMISLASGLSAANEPVSQPPTPLPPSFDSRFGAQANQDYTWEFKVLQGSAADTENGLNQLSSAAWEVVSSSSAVAGSDARVVVTVILRRQKLLPPHQPREEGAAVEWTKSEGGNGHFYVAVAAYPNTNWADAAAYAKARGGYLATASSAAENQKVIEALHAPGFNIQSRNNYDGFWLGGVKSPESQAAAEGWHWVAGQEAFTYTNWDRGEPNNMGGNEDRLEVNSSGIWNDLPGAMVNNGFVMEFDVKPAEQTPTQAENIITAKPLAGELTPISKPGQS